MEASLFETQPAIVQESLTAFVPIPIPSVAQDLSSAGLEALSDVAIGNMFQYVQLE